jgi:hypothetical protein
MAARSNVTEENFIDVDPWMEQQSRDNDPRGEQQQRASGSSGVKERVLKMNALIDQHDDSELLLPPSPADVDRWYQNYIVTMGSQPDETEEPTANQLAALHKRVFIENRPPYCDFSVWVPLERRMSRIQKVQGIHPFRGRNVSAEGLAGSRHTFSLEGIVACLSHGLPDVEHLFNSRS